MKKIFFLFITLLICTSVCGCSPAAPEPIKYQPPDIPQTLYAITEITPACMAELESQVSGLDIADFLHPDRIDTFEKQGITLSVANIQLKYSYDVNTATVNSLCAAYT